MNIGHWEGLIGGSLGVIGGLVGTFYSVRSTRGPRERRFVIYAAVLVWMILASLAALVFLVPWLSGWVPFAIGLLAIVGGVWMNRRQETLRGNERLD